MAIAAPPPSYWNWEEPLSLKSCKFNAPRLHVEVKLVSTSIGSTLKANPLEVNMERSDQLHVALHNLQSCLSHFGDLLKSTVGQPVNTLSANGPSPLSLQSAPGTVPTNQPLLHPGSQGSPWSIISPPYQQGLPHQGKNSVYKVYRTRFIQSTIKQGGI